jgi:hypothetical protein
VIEPSPSAAYSLPVKTVSTPGIADASAQSINVIEACAYGDRTMKAWSWFG